MPDANGFAFALHQMLVLVAGSVCLFGTWIGMRHFARARATSGTHAGRLAVHGFRLHRGIDLGVDLHLHPGAGAPPCTALLIPFATGAVLLIAIGTCLVGFEVGSRHFTLAPEAGGVVIGAGVLGMHFIALKGWHIPGALSWNLYGLVTTILLGLGLGALAVNRANRPVTRWCRHGAAIVLAFMICAMHYALTASATVVSDPSVVLPPYLLPANMLVGAVVGAVFLVMGSGFATYVIDLHVRTESADRIHQLSFNDTMTGLPNRIAFNERLAFDASEAHEKAHKLAAFSIDLDGFKDVNDVFGHGAGDLLLIEVADRMRRVLGPGEFLARQSGDEFLGLQMSGNHPRDAQAFAERIAGAFAEPFQLQGQPVGLTASIGYSLFPVDTAERDQLLSNAKLAMHRGKSKQRGSICMYSREMDDTARARRALARDLQSAVERGELELHYQLQTSLGDGRISGAEALMRWRHPKHGMISPARIHSARRGNRGHRRHGRMGTAHRLPRCRPGQNSRYCRGQPVAGAVLPRRSGGDDPRDPARDRPVAAPARGRGHGIDRDVRPEPRFAHPAQIESDGDIGGDGRFRHRLFVAVDAARLPVRQDQARPVVRETPAQ